MSVEEHLLKPEYWDGHSFGDFCGGIRINYLQSSSEEKQQRKLWEADKTARSEFARTIWESLLKGYPKTNEVIDSGMFEGANYEIGTPIRIHREKLWRDKEFKLGALFRSIRKGIIEPLNWDEPVYLATTYLAVITDSNLYPDFLRRRFIEFPEYFFNERRSTQHLDMVARVRVRVVEHHRSIDDRFSTNDRESLSRVTRIEVFG